MKFTKKEIKEIVDGDASLIGGKGVPTHGSDLESSVDNTTDYNMKISKQPFRYDMMGRFGFTLLPFFESEDSQEKLELMGELGNLFLKKQIEKLNFYIKNPKRLKPDYRKLINNIQTSDNDENSEYVIKIMKIVEKHFNNAFGGEDIIDEDKMIGEFISPKTNKDNLVDKNEEKDILDDKLKDIAGLISKLDDSDIEKLKKFLENSNVK